MLISLILLSENINFDFLNGSQTFLGIILTLNVLCLFAVRDNNFILNALLSFKDRFKDNLEELKSNIDKDKEAIRSSENYKTVERIQIDNKYNPEIKNQASSLLYRYSIESDISSISLTNNYVELDNIEKRNEQFRAPLFTLLFGLTIFIVDEICRFCNNIDTFSTLIVFTWIFTSLSFFYWLLIWGFFVMEHSSTQHSQNKSNLLNFIDRHINFKVGSLMKLVLCIFIFYIAMYFCQSITNQASLTAILFIAALLPIFLIGMYREINCAVRGSYSFMHICGHLSAFIIYAVCITFISTNYFNQEVLSLPLFKDIRLLRLILVLFVLVNSLILPFALPYLKYRNTYLRVLGQLNRQRTRLRETAAKFNNEFNNFCKSLSLFAL